MGVPYSGTPTRGVVLDPLPNCSQCLENEVPVKLGSACGKCLVAVKWHSDS